MNDNTVRVFTTTDLALTSAEAGSEYWCVKLPNVMLTFYKVDPHMVFDMHSHASEQITYVTRGTLVFEVEGQRLPVRSGEAIRLPANVPHSACSLEEEVEAFDAWSPPAQEPWTQEERDNGIPVTPDGKHGLPLGKA